MSVQKTSGGLDFEALRQAIENLDADLLLSLYADDAEMRTINRYTTPSSPKVLKGKEQIAEYLRDVRPGDDAPHRERGDRRGAGGVQRGVRVPGRGQGPVRGD